jgi:hypothetical protein
MSMAAKVSGTFRQSPNDPLNDCEVIVINIKDLTLKKICRLYRKSIQHADPFPEWPYFI